MFRSIMSEARDLTGSFQLCLNNCGAKMCIFISDLVYSYENVLTKIQNYYNELAGIKIYLSDALYLYNDGIVF